MTTSTETPDSADPSSSAARVPEVGTELRNPVAGTCTVFLATAASTGGAHVELRHTYPPHSPHPPMHLHPQQDEHFTVESGRLHAVVGEQERDLDPGDELEVPRGTPHQMWSVSDEPTVVLWRTTPALRTDAMHAELFQVLADNDFVPDLMASWGVVQRYPDEFRLC